MSSDAPEMTLDGIREAITELPTIPETLTRILQLLEDPNSGARDLAEVILGKYGHATYSSRKGCVNGPDGTGLPIPFRRARPP